MGFDYGGGGYRDPNFWSERRCVGGLAAGGRSGHYKRRYFLFLSFFLSLFYDPHLSRRVCGMSLKFSMDKKPILGGQKGKWAAVGSRNIIYDF